ncbi:hypothetical protein QVD17_19566 [Tagetes erecta]|uniref:Uncharacterized protein n=1 Tax=Tagetes erecta TaxID=13708 RepID=A0AAD8NQ84_TARER|nr:hypothetical protein QVD17_19566 [Tagetes erecta]
MVRPRRLSAPPLVIASPGYQAFSFPILQSKLQILSLLNGEDDDEGITINGNKNQKERVCQICCFWGYCNDDAEEEDEDNEY